MNKRWIVTAVDISESSDHKARVLAVCKSKEEAQSFIRNDMEDYVDDAAGMNLTVDFDKMSASTEDGNYGCEWNAEEVEV